MPAALLHFSWVEPRIYMDETQVILCCLITLTASGCGAGAAAWGPTGYMLTDDGSHMYEVGAGTSDTFCTEIDGITSQEAWNEINEYYTPKPGPLHVGTCASAFQALFPGAQILGTCSYSTTGCGYESPLFSQRVDYIPSPSTAGDTLATATQGCQDNSVSGVTYGVWQSGH